MNKTRRLPGKRGGSFPSASPSFNGTLKTSFMVNKNSTQNQPPKCCFILALTLSQSKCFAYLQATKFTLLSRRVLLMRPVNLLPCICRWANGRHFRSDEKKERERETQSERERERERGDGSERGTDRESAMCLFCGIAHYFVHQH